MYHYRETRTSSELLVRESITFSLDNILFIASMPRSSQEPSVTRRYYTDAISTEYNGPDKDYTIAPSSLLDQKAKDAFSREVATAMLTELYPKTDIKIIEVKSSQVTFGSADQFRLSIQGNATIESLLSEPRTNSRKKQPNRH
jgi:hypothetical protein